MPVIVRDCEQGSPRWTEIRRGIVTGTAMKSIVTPATGKLSSERKKYQYNLVAQAMGEWEQGHGTKEMQLGVALEDNARAAYELQMGPVEQVAFVFGDETRRWGCSPDGLVGENAGVELKVPMLKTLIKYNEENRLPGEYRGQIYANMYVTGRKIWDLFCYSRWESERHFLYRTTGQDPQYVEWATKMDTELQVFLDELEDMRKRRGLEPLGAEKISARLEKFSATAPGYTSETISLAEGQAVTYF